MSGKLKKGLLLVLAAVLLVGSSQLQRSLNRERDALGLTRVEALENAPPVLAFTTVALGGFRGIISNLLWIRANDLQDDDKFFEMAQLADWITKLEPNFVQVWLMQAWNMAYNISVKFKDYPDRWRWVKRGVELLRDDGLRYNPNEVLIYRELGWFFQHKMGQNLDDASMYYKQQWANEMAAVFDKKKPNLDELIHPQTADQTNRARLLREKYKMDPEFMKKVDEQFGPLEWRLPESSAVYWAAKGLKAAKENPTKVNPDDFITLRRVIYQSMQLSFKRGRLIADPFSKTFDFGPNLDIIPKVSAAYEQEANEDPKMHDHILSAHRNFLRDAVFYLYEHNRMRDATTWFNYLCKQYHDKRLLDGNPDSMPGTLTVDDYVFGRVKEMVGETMGRDEAQAAIEGYLASSYQSLALDEDDRSAGQRAIARQIWNAYTAQLPKERLDALALRPFADIDTEIRNRLLDPQHGLPVEVRAVLRSKLSLPAETKEVKQASAESVPAK
ncbi:MAG TPA: hypothetical protein VLT36_17195 [Candidatus Dormibacteraeota bacterium]|nr:hypothetical protein [Candidatus Dormibacteraeota bacterium]